MTSGKALVVCILVLLLTGCSSLMSSVTSGMANDLADAILNSEDIDTVREGVPAYLLLIDSFLASSPQNIDLLIAASSLNGAYSVFTEGERAQRLTSKSLRYAAAAACVHDVKLCDLQDIPFDTFETVVADLKMGDVAVAYALGVAWTSWLQAHSADWNAIAQLSRVRSLMEKVIELNESFDAGGPHLYMGGLETVLPASMGGRPDKGKEHFEKALKLSNGQFLMTKVIYAENYARLVFDQALHDRLLNEVLAADAVVPGMTLTNKIAQERARELLAESNEYF